MKPKPFSALNHFTVPTGMLFSSLTCGMDNSRVTGTGDHGVRRPSPRWSSRTSCRVSLGRHDKRCTATTGTTVRHDRPRGERMSPFGPKSVAPGGLAEPLLGSRGRPPTGENSVPDDRCPCGSGDPFVECCGRYLDGGRVAPTAEALMRSRYPAFARRDVDHLLAS